VNRVDPVAVAGFGSAAEVYERARPSYPADAIDWLLERADVGAGDTIVDLGAGTGKLTRLLVPSGARIVAVEPIPEMRAHIDVGEAVDGTAEAIPLTDGSAALVTAAQAFHWFDHDHALPEIHRVLRPDGALGLVWNMRDLDDPLQRSVEELLQPIRRELPAQAVGAWREPLQRSALFGPAVVGRFTYEQQFTADDLCDRVASTSFVAAMSAVDREELLVRVRALAAGLEEPFPFRYLSEVHVLPRMGDRGRGEGGTSIQG
jgi:SAM-dependent methyltransferase